MRQDALDNLNSGEGLVLNRFGCALWLVGSMAEFTYTKLSGYESHDTSETRTVQRALPECDGHNAVFFLCQCPVCHTATCGMNYLTTPVIMFPNEHPGGCSVS